jgi:hypothetical protein
MIDKKILVQYCDLQQEIKDLRQRIEKVERVLHRMVDGSNNVSDTVKGTRKDGTYGSITISGIPYAEIVKKEQLILINKKKLEIKVQELLSQLNEVEDFIEEIEDSRIRRIFRHRYIDNLSWIQVAHRMGGGHTSESCRNAHDRALGLKK